MAGDPLGGLGGEELGLRGLGVGRGAAVDQPGGVLVGLPGGHHVAGHVGQQVPDRLLLGDRPAELHPLLGVDQGVLEGATGQADRARRGLHPRHVEPAEAVLEALALLLAGLLQRVERQPQVGQLELPGGQAEVADLVDRAALDAGGEGATVLLDQEQLQPVGGAPVLARRAGAGEEVDEVRGQGVPHPALGPVDDPAVAVALGGAGHVGEVGARLRLGEGDRADPPTRGRQPAQPGADLRVGAVAAGAVAAGDDAADAHPGAGQLLGHQAVVEDAQPQAALVLGDQHPEQAELAHPLQQVGRDVLVQRVEPVGDREDLVHREGADPLDQCRALRGVVRRRRRRDGVQRVQDVAVPGARGGAHAGSPRKRERSERFRGVFMLGESGTSPRSGRAAVSGCRARAARRPGRR